MASHDWKQLPMAMGKASDNTFTFKPMIREYFMKDN
jgi:hypothetical protein